MKEIIIYFGINCKSSFFIYHLQCVKSENQYSDRSKTFSNHCLSIHTKGIYKNSIPASDHFHESSNNLSGESKFHGETKDRKDGRVYSETIIEGESKRFE